MAAPGKRTRVKPVREDTSVMVVTSSAFGVDEEKRKDLEVHRFETEPAYVRINHGMTKKIGEYESLRVDVSITVPCYVEEINEVAARIADEVSARLDEELNAYGVK